MMKSRKGDISITTIIVAAVGLVVLIVLIAIFTGRIRLFGDTYDTSTTGVKGSTCNAQPGGGYCLSKTATTGCSSGRNLQDSPTGGGTWIDYATSERCCGGPA